MAVNFEKWDADFQNEQKAELEKICEFIRCEKWNESVFYKAVNNAIDKYKKDPGDFRSLALCCFIHENYEALKNYVIENNQGQPNG